MHRVGTCRVRLCASVCLPVRGLQLFVFCCIVKTKITVAESDMALGSIFSNLFRSSSTKEPEAAPAGAANALDERMAHRRETVAQAVTEAMMDVGVVSSGYRHEVRHVDARGHRFVVSIDLPRELASTTAGILAQIGASITRKAGIKNNAEVVGVYWRAEYDDQAPIQEPLNLLAASLSRGAAPVPVAPEIPAAPAAQSADETAADRIAKLRDLMKDDGRPARGAKPAAGPVQSAGIQAPPDEDEPDHGFANTVIGMDVDDTPPKKR